MATRARSPTWKRLERPRSASFAMASAASEVIARIRALLKRTATNRLPLDINEVIQETMALAQNEARRRRVSLRTDFAANLPSVLGDRVQLQQVILNLMMNGIEAMSSVSDGSRQLLIKTQRDDSDQVLISVTDSGIGLDPKHAERLLKRSLRPRQRGWAWGYRSAVLSLRLMAAACGPPRMPDRARHSSLPSQ